MGTELGAVGCKIELGPGPDRDIGNSRNPFFQAENGILKL